ncbi:yqkD [Symbiodinium sp. CCMP2456]|nr:yqkD [Symbiodinium sp. CCMP2456]
MIEFPPGLAERKEARASKKPQKEKTQRSIGERARERKEGNPSYRWLCGIADGWTYGALKPVRTRRGKKEETTRRGVCAPAQAGTGRPLCCPRDRQRKRERRARYSTRCSRFHISRQEIDDLELGAKQISLQHTTARESEPAPVPKSFRPQVPATMLHPMSHSKQQDLALGLQKASALFEARLRQMEAAKDQELATLRERASAALRKVEEQRALEVQGLARQLEQERAARDAAQYHIESLQRMVEELRQEALDRPSEAEAFRLREQSRQLREQLAETESSLRASRKGLEDAQSAQEKLQEKLRKAERQLKEKAAVPTLPVGSSVADPVPRSLPAEAVQWSAPLPEPLPVEPGYEGYADERPSYAEQPPDSSGYWNDPTSRQQYYADQPPGSTGYLHDSSSRRPSYAEQPPDSSGYWNDPTSRQQYYADQPPGSIGYLHDSSSRRPSYAEQPPDSPGYWNNPTSRQDASADQAPGQDSSWLDSASRFAAPEHPEQVQWPQPGFGDTRELQLPFPAEGAKEKKRKKDKGKKEKKSARQPETADPWASPNSVPVAPEQPEEGQKIEALKAMGFEEARIRQVLEAVGGSVEKAVPVLLADE